MASLSLVGLAEAQEDFSEGQLGVGSRSLSPKAAAPIPARKRSLDGLQKPGRAEGLPTYDARNNSSADLLMDASFGNKNQAYLQAALR